MKITTRAEYTWSTRQNKYILLRDFVHYSENVAWCKGASAEQNDLAKSQTAFYNTLQNDTNTSFSNQQNVLSALQNTFNPIVQAGPNQYGFNAAQTNALNGSVINNTAAQYASAARALGAQQAAQGGGNTLLPSGVKSQQQARLASASAAQTASGLTGVQQAGYEQGRQNYANATNALSGVANQYGSGASSFAGSANSAGANAGSEWNTITQMNNAASPWNTIGGILGGAASAFGGGLAGPIGGAIGKSFGKGFSGATGAIPGVNGITDGGA